VVAAVAAVVVAEDAAVVAADAEVAVAEDVANKQIAPGLIPCRRSLPNAPKQFGILPQMPN
jgi:hypothetical protein